MATKIISLSSDSNVDDDYIDMELTSSSSNFICYSINSSPPQSREFEFQMGSVSSEKETTTSPADELFYKGKLLPLHLPPRLKMVQKLLQNNTASEMQFEDQSCDNSFIASSTTPSTNNNTPLESCNISPSESCRVSSELNPDEYFFEWSTELNSFIRDERHKNPWTKKLKKSSLSQKLKASSAYIKSLFSKSGCTDETAAKPAGNVETETGTKTKEIKYMKIPKKIPMRKNIYNDRTKLPTSTTTLFKSIEKEMAEDYNFCLQRRSFSGAIQSHSTTKFSSFSSVSSSGSSSSSSSSSFSFGSNGFNDLLKRSSSANSELENSIEGAIAHCKQSQLLFNSRKTKTLEVGVCSFSASENAACRDQQRPKLCSV